MKQRFIWRNIRVRHMLRRIRGGHLTAVRAPGAARPPGPLCHEETTIAGVRDQIRKAVREALDELATTPVVATAEANGTGAAGGGNTEVADDPEAAAGADDQ